MKSADPDLMKALVQVPDLLRKHFMLQMSAPAPQTIIKNRRWWRRERPFTHFVATDVFVPEFYAELESAFREVLARGLSQTSASGFFKRATTGYDAYIYPFPPSISSPLAFFISRGWCDLLASLAKVAVTGDVSAALHHHEPESSDGTVHNDLNPGWFITSPREDGINPADSSSCDYKRGVPHKLGGNPIERIRALSMIFFLNNGPWRPGDGGECALYARQHAPLDEVSVPPINNSLLVFECTPYSYHRFLSNRAGSRDSIILWLHRERQYVVERWGESAIVKWSR
jgi:hypothetical protein